MTRENKQVNQEIQKIITNCAKYKKENKQHGMKSGSYSLGKMLKVDLIKK